MTQCKDIPTLPILEFVRDLKALKTFGTWFCWLDENKVLVVPAHSVVRAMPQGTSLPEKLVLAKMKKLIRSGLIDGCDCGCRGDYEITNKGLEYIAQFERREG